MDYHILNTYWCLLVTFLYWKSLNRYYGKQWRPRWNAIQRTISSGKDKCDHHGLKYTELVFEKSNLRPLEICNKPPSCGSNVLLLSFNALYRHDRNAQLLTHGNISVEFTSKLPEIITQVRGLACGLVLLGTISYVSYYTEFNGI